MRFPLVTLFAVAASIFVTACSFNNVRSSSPLNAMIAHQPHGSNTTAKSYILGAVPIGSSSEMVRSFIKKHFKSPIRKTYDLPIEPKGASHFTVRVEGSRTWVGSSWTEVVFEFDEKDRLEDVVVYRYGVYL